ncbi:ABC transporter ATP-binding protein [Rhodococcus sp. NPDC060090]|uniref:ABC transporter ATP-binding protein n=1 Tax=Rhodococcus sp. NPDC060090 TaxID=3347056 RepID=UPI0036593775
MWRTLRRHRGRMTIAVVLCGLHQLFEALVPVAIGAIVANAIAPGDRTVLVAWLIGLALLFTALTYSWRLGARLVVAAMEGEGHRLRVEVTDTLLRPRGVRTDMRAGELLSVATSDADRTTWILDLVARAVAGAVAVIATAVILFVIDIPLGLGVLVGTVALLAALHFAAPVIAHRTAEQQARIGTASAVATDLVTGLRPLRGFGGEVEAGQRFRAVSDDALTATLGAAKVRSVFAGVSTSASALLAVAVAAGAGWLALSGRIGLAEVITVVGLAQFLIEPLTTLAQVPAAVAASRGSADRVARVLDSAPLLHPGSDDVSHRAQGPVLELADLTYRTLDRLDLTIARGEFVGIVAYRPEDADALFALLSSQVPADDYIGSFTVGSVPARDLPIELARTLVLAEPHDTFLFSGTLRSNITAGSHITAGCGSDASIDLERALDASAARDVVDLHPSGLDQPVGDDGTTLSGGQRQRVALARALAADPPVLVLHDPTTAVDSVTELNIAEGLLALRHGTDPRTTIVLTSSPALLAAADRVVVIDEGRVVATATHHQLVEIDAVYQEAVVR